MKKNFSYMGLNEMDNFLGNNNDFYAVPTFLYDNDKFKGLGNVEKIMYAMLMDKFNSDEKLEVTVQDISKRLNCSDAKVVNLLNDLRSYSLVAFDGDVAKGKFDLYIKSFEKVLTELNSKG